MPVTFQSFDKDTFAKTTVNTITFGTKDSNVDLDSGSTNESTNLARIINLFAKDLNSIDSTQLDKSAILTKDQWTTSENNKTRTINGLTWTFDSNAKTIKCTSTNGFVYKDSSSSNAFAQFKDNKPISVVINLSDAINNYLKN